MVFRARSFVFSPRPISSRPARIGVGGSIYVHRVAFNTSRRNLPPRTALDGTRYRPPTPVDLHFLVTAWGRTPEEQLSMLGWIIRTLEDTPVLPAGLLNRFAGNRGEVFSSNEAVEIVGEILSFQDMLQHLGNRQDKSATVGLLRCAHAIAGFRNRTDGGRAGADSRLRLRGHR